MTRGFRAFVTMAVAVALAGMGALAAPTATATPPAGQTGTYIVVLEPGSSSVRSEASSLARQHGGRVGFVYEHALRGFSITASSAAAAALARNPRVSYVEADQAVTLADQTTPTGLGRIFAADSNPAVAEGTYNPNLDIDGSDDWRVDVDVAVIDTGIDLNNPDLNVVGSINCLNVSTGSCVAGGDDDHYHGTHVAGTIAAIDNGIGVVGVAPGARLWAVKVLGSSGSGSDAGVIAGINWVLAHNASTSDSTGDIEVANMSLGGSKSVAENDAVNAAVSQGVTMVVAAGNSAADANNYSPASAAGAITVSALADFNGLPGGLAAATCRSDMDDTFANFSNYGTVVDIIAPGVCITSTNNNSTSLRTISGTSMASPHVAGAAALLRSVDNNGTETELEAGNFDWNLGTGVVNDGVKEPLLDVSNTGVFAPWLVPGAAAGNTPPVASFTSSCADAVCSFDGTLSSDAGGTVVSYAWTFGDGGSGTGSTTNHTYSVSGTFTVTLTVTDNLGATGSAQQQVAVTAPTPVLSFSGSATSQRSSWTARVNVSGALAGSTVSGSWDIGGTPNSCVASTSGTCSFSRKKIANTSARVTWTYGEDQTKVVTIAKP